MRTIQLWSSKRVYVKPSITTFEYRILTLPQGYKKVSPLFVPRLLINLAAGHISMRYGFKVRVTLPE